MKNDINTDARVELALRRALIAAMTGTLLLAATTSWAESAGMIKTSKGTANIERNGQKLPAVIGASVEARDRIVTGADGAVGITLRDNTMLSAGPNSVLDLNKFAFDTTTHAGALDASVKKGTLSVISGKLARANPGGVNFSTPTMTLGVRGTEFATEAGQSAADLTGYLVDSSGNPVRAGSGACIHSGSWSAQMPGIGCDATPDRVVLLPGPDGKAGAVVVRSAAGEKVLDSAYAGLEISKAKLVERQEDAASVQQRYGATLGAQPPRPVSYTVNFASGSSTELTDASKPIIEQIKVALAARPVPEITVIGHTDRIGNAEANDKLSLQRAEAVKDILLSASVKASHVDVAGRGEREPLVATADEVAEARNRRVEISVR